MDFHTYTLNLYEQQPAFWADEAPPEPRSYLCEARRRTLLDRLLNRPGELVWDEWVETIDQWHALEREALQDGLTFTTDPRPSA